MKRLRWPLLVLAVFLAPTAPGLLSRAAVSDLEIRQRIAVVAGLTSGSGGEALLLIRRSTEVAR